jgi:hypothetical protein
MIHKLPMHNLTTNLVGRTLKNTSKFACQV